MGSGCRAGRAEQESLKGRITQTRRRPGAEGVESDLGFLLLGPQSRPGPILPAQPG